MVHEGGSLWGRGGARESSGPQPPPFLPPRVSSYVIYIATGGFLGVIQYLEKELQHMSQSAFKVTIGELVGVTIDQSVWRGSVIDES